METTESGQNQARSGRCAALQDAAGALLRAIHDGGGWCVFDPQYQVRMHNAITALLDAYELSLLDLHQGEPK